MLIGKVAGAAGFFAPVAFIGAGVIAGFTALSFAELSARFPRSAGEAVYVREGFNSSALALLVGLMVIAAGTVSAATIAIGAAGYIAELIEWPLIQIAALLIALLGIAAAWGVMESVGLACIFTLIEIAGLLMIVVVVGAGLPDIGERVETASFAFDEVPWNGLFIGTVLAFYAFIGFEDMVNVAEEVKDVRRVLPRAIVMTLLITVVIYILISVIAVLAAAPSELSQSAAPLAYLFGKYGGSTVVITVIAIFATTNGALIQIIMASRVIYGLSRQGALPALVGRINRRTQTPILATGLVTVCVILFAVWLPIEQLAELTSVIALSVFALVNAALICVKTRHAEAAPQFLLPLWVPVCGVATSGGALLIEVTRLVG